ncbi:DUF2141 domain-containing protein [Sphingomonas oligophenolica]|uniref:DUF2141 domain-containing protein n=1 Tax=Sphingomonas oligophenolica TaxID=301154 RepID=A0ABU9Y7U1_9SPHN
MSPKSRTLFLAGIAMAATLTSGSLGAAARPAAQDGEGACTGTPSATRLYVTVQGVRSSQGLIAVTLYADDPKRFLVKHGSLYVGRVAATAPTTRVCIHLPAPGTYAIAVYHDINGNQKFDRNMLGLPKEAYGFSNNASTFFGLPSFSSVRIAVPHNDMAISVKLKYP